MKKHFFNIFKIITLIIFTSTINTFAAPFMISITDRTSVAGGVGTTKYWTDAGSVGGVPISLRATVVSISAGDRVSIFGSGDNPVIRPNTSSNTAEILWEAFERGTTTPIFGDPQFLITDVDGAGTRRIESVSALCTGLTSYTVNGNYIEGINANRSNASQSNIRITESGGTILAEGTQNQSGNHQEGFIQYNWTNVSSWTVNYISASRGRWYTHDGDADIPFDGTQTNIPLVDLATIVEVAAGSLTNPGVGQEVTYNVKMSNAGPDAANNVNMTFDLPVGLDYVPTFTVSEGNYDPATGIWDGVDLNVGEEQVLTITGRVQNGRQGFYVENQAVKAGSDESSCSSRDSLTYGFQVPYLPELNVTKTITSGTPYTKAGDIVNYEYSVTNVGDVRIVALSVIDDKIASVSCLDTSLDMIESTTCTASYTITQDDVLNQSITNVATANGTVSPINGNAVPVGSILLANEVNATAVLLPDPKLEVKKEVDTTTVNAPATLNYIIDINNTGNVPLSNVAPTDTLPNGTIGILSAVTGDTNSDGKLDLDEVWHYTISYNVTQADMDAGVNLVNTISVVSDEVITPVTDTAVTTITALPNLVVDKAGDKQNVTVPSTVNYIIIIDNSGNTSLTNITLVDTLPNGTTATIPVPTGDTDGDNELDIDETWVYIMSYFITQAEIDAGIDRVNLISVTTTEIPVAKTDTAVTTITRTPSITMKKSAATPTVAQGLDSTITDEGDTITYTLVANNTGNVSLSNVQVSDSIASVSSCVLVSDGSAFVNDGTSSLAVGDSVSCTAVYTLTNADLDAGGKDNTATVNAQDPSAVPLSATDTISSALTQKAAIVIVKSAGVPTDNDNDGSVEAGDTVSYEFNVTNTSNVTLTNVTVEDKSLSIAPFLATFTGVDCGGGSNVVTSLAAGAVVQCTSTYTLTQDDIDGNNAPTITSNAGEVEVDNEANVTGTPPVGSGLTPPVATSSALAKAQTNTALAFEKTAANVVDVDGDGLDSQNDTITYTYKVENKGAATLKDVTVTEGVGFTGTGATPSPSNESSTNVSGSSTDAAIDGSWDSLNPGDIVLFTAVYTLTQADIDTGFVNNSASAEGAPFPSGMSSPTGSGSAVVVFAQKPSLTLSKTASDTTDVAVGDTITYTYEVNNTGNVGIDAVSITDVHSGTGTLTAITPASVDLAPSATQIFTATYVVTQADVDAGADITNTATVTGTPKGGTLTDVTDSEVVDVVDPTPLLVVTKTADDTTDVVVGQTITYTYEINNTGNVGIDSISVSDLHSGTGTAPLPSGGVTSLAPGASTIYTATYVVTQADVDAGADITNTATVTGIPKGGTLTDVTDSEVVDVVDPTPLLVVTKTADDTTDVVVGQTITYTYEINNTGNVGIDSISVSDLHSGTGTAPLPSGGVTSLAPGASTIYTATYVVTQADVDAGADITNTATVTGTPKGGILSNATGSEVVGIIAPSPELNITKTASKRTDAVVGDVITYTYVVGNSGNVKIVDVNVTDVHNADGNLSAIILSLGNTTLAPGESATFTAEYMVRQEDIDLGTDITNTATANGVPAGGVLVPINVNETVQLIAQDPKIDVRKFASNPTIGNGFDSTIVDAGDSINYTIRIENRGNVRLDNVTITDANATIISCNNTSLGNVFLNDGTDSLDLGEQVTCLANVVLVEQDLDNGSRGNTASVTATSSLGVIVNDTDTVISTFTQKAAIVIVKNAGVPTVINGANNAVVDAGDTISYEFNVTNTSNITLTDVVVTDMNLSMVLDCGTGTNIIASLIAGITQTCTATYTLTQDDIDGTGNPAITNTAGNIEINNEANVTGTPPANSGLTPPIATASALAEAQVNAALAFEKTVSSVNDVNGDGADSVGDTITYTYTVENKGVTTLTDINVTENATLFTGTGTLPVPTVSSGDATSLAPNAVVTFTATYTLTQADIDAGKVENSATGQGTAPAGMAAPKGVGSAVINFVQSGQYNMVKGVDQNSITAPTTLNYTFEFVNYGNVALFDLTVTDVNITVGSLSCEADANNNNSIDTLLPGETKRCTASREITQVQIDAGADIYNTAIPSADANTTMPFENDDETNTAPNDPSDNTAITSIMQTPELNIIKTADKTSNVVVGDTITYTYEVNNTGNISIDAVSISDNHSGTGILTAITPASVDLAPMTGQIFTATYVVTQADIDAGLDINNIATVTGTPKGGTLTDVNATESVDVQDPSPALSMIKTADDVTDVVVGQTITYSYEVNNTGNISIDAVSVSDVHQGSGTLTAITPASVDLAPNTGQIFTATYVVTQADIDAGVDINNTATVTGTPKLGTLINVTASENVDVANPLPTLSMSKTASDTTDVVVGDTITYSYEVNNTGNISIDNVSVSDVHLGTGTLSAITPDSVNLAPNAGQLFTATYIVTQADIDAGVDINNTATVTGSPKGGTLTDVDATESVDVVDPAPLLVVVKTADDTTDVVVGQTITYSYEVNNTGNVGVDAITVSDIHTGTGIFTAPSGGATVLLPGESTTYTTTYVVTQDDIDAGNNIDNTVIVAGTSRGIVPLGDATDSESVDVQDPTPTLSMTKIASDTTDVAVGDTITYTYEVNNTGNISVDAVSVSDVHQGTGTLTAITPASVDLVPNAGQIFTATYVVTQADIDAGIDINNTATVTGTPNGGTLTDVNATESVDVADPVPSLSLSKDASKDTDVKVGDNITYTYTVENTGNVGIDNITVSDVHLGQGTLGAISPSNITLAPGAKQVFTAIYTITQDDIDLGLDINNTATVTGTPQGGALTDVNATKSVKPEAIAPESTVTKVASTPTIVNGVDATITDADDNITYTIVTTNTGNVSLLNVLVSDSITSISSCGLTSNGDVFNNDGSEGLDVGESVTCTAVYTLSTADLDAGAKDNTASATAEDRYGTSANSSATVSSSVTQTASIVLVKRADTSALATPAAAGDVLTYSFDVNNTSNVTLSNVIVIDKALGVAPFNMVVDCGSGTNVITSMGANTNVTCTGTYALTQDDIDGNNAPTITNTAGTVEIANDANVTGTPPVGSGLTSPTALASALADANVSASLSMAKTVSVIDDKDSNGVDSVGDEVTYTYTVKNEGTTTLSNVLIEENATAFTGTGTLPVAVVSSGDATSLAPGATVVFTAVYVLTQDDIDAGMLSNTAKGTATPPVAMTAPEAQSSAVVIITQKPAYNMVKTVSPLNITGPTVLDYTFTFTNTGNVRLHAISLIDPTIDAGTLNSCPIALMQVGDVATCTATRTITQSDIDAGIDIVNTATPSAKDPLNQVAPEDNDNNASTPNDTTDNTATTTITQSPELNITKTADKTSNVAVGDTITYTYEVNNTGNISIDAVSISDNHSGTGILTAITPASVNLAPMTGQIFTATYVVTQDDIDAGADISNTATVTGTPKGGTLTDVNASETVDLIDRISDFTMSKSSTATDAQVGDSLPYTFTVINTGNVTLTAPSITDVKCLAIPTLASESLTADTRLEVGETQTYTCMSIAVTQTEVDAGVVLNSASITATPPVGATPPSPQDANTTVPVNQTPAYTFAKATASVPTQAGDTLVYTFEVNNTGNVSLDTIVIADAKCDASGVSLDTESMTADTILEVGETQVYKCTSLTVLQSEVDVGEVNNTASITVDVPPSATPPAPQNSSVSTPIVPTPALSMIKTASADMNLAVGQEITYSYEVNNTGNITLDDVTVTDNHLGSGVLTSIVPASVTLAPAQVQVFTAKYTITQADVDAGVDVNNTATVTANPKGGTLTDVNATESVDVADPIPALSITKVADKKNNVKVGDTITYTYTVENTGNIGIDDVNVSDVHVADGSLSAITLTSASNDLAPGDKAEFIATYVVTQGDIDLGKDINNTATGNGTAKLGTLAPVDVNESVDLEDIAPEIFVAKVASAPTVINGVENNITDADDNITYTITLENIGNVSLQNVVANDSITTIDSCGLTSNGDVFVNDGTGTLDVGERVLCTAVYTLTTADLDAGSRSNTASVSAEDRHGTTATDTTTVSSAVTQTASIVMVKKANNSAVQNPASAGDIISYIFEVRNTSNVTLTNVIVTDNALGVAPFNMAVDCTGTPNVIASMAAHSTAQCTATYALTQADIDGTNAPTITNTAGVIEVTNDANVTGTPPLGSGLTPPTASASALAEANVSASLSMTKTAGSIVDTNADGVDSAGDSITYTYTVKNEGTTTLANIVVDENATNFTGTGTVPVPTVSTGNATSLAPNDTVVFTATYILTQADIDAAGLSNTASVKGEPSPPNGMLPPTASSSIAVVITQKPSFNMVKVVTPTNITGPTVLDYIFTFTNTGNVTLKDINLTDTNIDAGSLNGCPIATLNVGAVVTCSATRAITQDMIDTGVDIVNIASANAKDPLGQTANEDNDNNQSTANDFTDNTATTTITQTPKLSIVKTADKTTNITVGETITYSYEVNNTGNITIDTINVVDVHSGLGVLSAMNQTDITLAPNQGTVFKTTYVVTQDDIDSGADISNSATVDGDAKGGTLNSVEDNETVSVAPAVAQIALVKRLVPQVAPYALGDTMHYVFDVNNTGNVTLYGVNISDTNATVSGSPITLVPGQVDSSTFTAIHVITQDDINRGSVHNQAQVKSQDLQGNDIEDKSDDDAFDENDPTITPIVSMPGISITKKGTFDSNSSVQLGDTISYEFNITNTGNVTLFNIKVEDTNATVTGNPITLAPGESNTTAYTAIHIVTQDDIDANKVVNQAVVLAKEPNGNDINASSDDPNTVASNDPTVTQLPIASPMAATDEANGSIGQPSTVDILANDNGGTFAIDPSSVKIVAPDGSLVTELVVAGEGVWKVNPDGTITFTPNADFSGDPTPIKYRVDDIQGNPVTTDGEIKIDYPPVAIDDIVSSLLVEPVTIKILDNDKNTSTPLDPESVSLVPPANAINIVRDAEGDIIEFTVTEGVWSVDELTGEVTFTPANSFTGGDLAAIAYTVQETDGKLVSNEASITVNYVAHVLEAINDGTITIRHYGANVIDVLKNDEFTGDVTIKILEQPKHGKAEVAIGSDGRPVIIYTPDPDINYVPDSFRYSITDINGQVSEATVKLDVQCVTSQESDGGDTYGMISILIMMFMTIMTGFYLVRREESLKENERGEV